MDSLHLILSLVALLAPLVAAVAIASPFSRTRGADESYSRIRSAAVLAKLGAAVSLAAATVALVRMASGAVTGDTWVDLATWFSVGPHDALRIRIGVDFDCVAAGLTAVMALAVIAAPAWDASETIDESSTRLFYGAASILLSCSIGIGLSTGLAELFVFWQLSAMAIYTMASVHADTSPRAAAMKKFVLVQRVGDAFLLCALFAFVGAFGTLEFHDVFRTPQEWGRIATQRGPFVEFIGLCLLGACVGRCALFPLFGWLEELAALPAGIVLLVEGICLLPTGAVILIRCLPLLNAAIASSALGAFVAALSALVMAVCAGAARESRRVAEFGCASVFASIVFGFFLGTPVSGVWSLVLLAIYVPFTTLILIACGPASERAEGRRPRILRGALAAATFLLFSGICGQGMLVVQALPLAVGRSTAFGVAIPLVIGAQFLAGAAMARVFLAARSRFPQAAGFPTIIETSVVGRESSGSPISRHGLRMFSPWMLLIGGTALAILSGSAASALPGSLSPGVGRLSGVSPAGLLIAACDCGVALFGFFVGWRRAELGQAAVPISLGGNRFYCDALLFMFIVLPIRGLAQLARFFDWFFVDAWLGRLPASAAESATAVFEPIQHRSVGFYVVSAVAGTGVLAAMIVWLHG